ncbi:conserved hypothetical protein [Sporisorium reilianum SRZ2]|uniref:Late effector protein 1 n=1 Tax=Sporisorium reilianum (strain SRZ2) TaxID=999809 RepID=LEP1_SPORE|nr:conserved hypothetical protein [Sporisorium reilianum SRZ2]
MKCYLVVVVAALCTLVAQGSVGAPIPKPNPIEDIYASQLPDPGTTAQMAAGDSAYPLTLLASFDPNDTSALH